MVVKRITNVSLRMTSNVLALALLMSGCLKENTDDCDVSHTLTVRAYDNSGVELTQGEVSDVRLFVFDAGLRFVERIDTQVGQKVTVKATGDGDMHVIGWGNLGGGQEDSATPVAGEHINNCLVSLKPAMQTSTYVLSPDDLFRGGITVPANEKSGDKILPVYRETGSMTITVRNLKTFAGYDDDNYSIAVRETYSVIDFYGKLSGDKVGYRPEGSFVANGNKVEYYAPAFNMLPEESIRLDIYHGTQLIATVSNDSSGNPIIVQKGVLTNVLIELGAQLSVSVALTDWGNEQVWKEF